MIILNIFFLLFFNFNKLRNKENFNLLVNKSEKLNKLLKITITKYNNTKIDKNPVNYWLKK